MTANVRPWHDLEGDECAQAVRGICIRLRADDSRRRRAYTRALSLYEGMPVSLDGADYLLADGAAGLEGLEVPTWNWMRSACDSLHAEVCGRQKPKPQAVGTDASWRARRRAVKLDRFIEAHLHQPQGCHASAWDVMGEVGKDWIVCGTGAARVWADQDAERVSIERVPPWELLVDAADGAGGNPLSLFHVCELDESIAEATWPDKLGAIRTAARMRQDGSVARSVEVREAWRRANGTGKPGKHVVCCDGGVLLEEDWTDDEFPFVFLQFSRPRRGFWGRGLCAEAEAAFDELNRASRAMTERIKICSTRRTYYVPGTVEEDHLRQGGDAEILIPVTSLQSIPQEVPPQPVSPGEVQHVDRCKSWFFESIGVSQMTASAQKDPGVTAAVAMRTLNDIQGVRFLPRARAYEQAFVELGRQIIARVRELVAAGKFPAARWPGKSFVRTIEWDQADLDADKYELRLASVNAMSRDPALVLQVAQELRDRGEIGKETFLQMVGLPDLDHLLSQETAETQYVDDCVERMLDAESDADLAKLGGYPTPDPLITNKPGALVRVLAAYFDSRRERVPEYPASLLRRWIVEVDRMIADASAPPQGAQGAPMGGPAGPMAPPGLQVAA